jgi:hypothetical protein
VWEGVEILEKVLVPGSVVASLPYDEGFGYLHSQAWFAAAATNVQGHHTGGGEGTVNEAAFLYGLNWPAWYSDRTKAIEGEPKSSVCRKFMGLMYCYVLQKAFGFIPYHHHTTFREELEQLEAKYLLVRMNVVDFLLLLWAYDM